MWQEFMCNLRACTTCKGTGVVKVLDLWTIIQQMKDGDDAKELPTFRGVACPECHNADFWGFVNALIDKRGQPLADGPIICAYPITHPQHGEVIFLSAEERPHD